MYKNSVQTRDGANTFGGQVETCQTHPRAAQAEITWRLGGVLTHFWSSSAYGTHISFLVGV